MLIKSHEKICIQKVVKEMREHSRRCRRVDHRHRAWMGKLGRRRARIEFQRMNIKSPSKYFGYVVGLTIMTRKYLRCNQVHPQQLTGHDIYHLSLGKQKLEKKDQKNIKNVSIEHWVDLNHINRVLKCKIKVVADRSMENERLIQVLLPTACLRRRRCPVRCDKKATQKRSDKICWEGKETHNSGWLTQIIQLLCYKINYQMLLLLAAIELINGWGTRVRFQLKKYWLEKLIRFESNLIRRKQHIFIYLVISDVDQRFSSSIWCGFVLVYWT